MELNVRNGFIKPLGDYLHVSHRTSEQTQERTSEAQVPQSTLIPLKMVVNAESLIIFVERPKFSQEWEILSWILVQQLSNKDRLQNMMRWNNNLLGVLGNHEHKGEVIHSEGSVEKPISINEEYDILHSFLHQIWVRFYHNE